ncbi:MAG TPA: LuxR C-terminal-related transcriptional regulator [Solirubrobacteraceae bacterium]|nr:LuxR C-terminal-related transcriptional regulator [Solirubrobacteraceae bacterium]
MVLVDSDRRYVEVNTSARLAFRASLGELRGRRTEDLTPAHEVESTTQLWARMLDTGCVAGTYELASLDGSRLEVSYFGVANVLEGLHLGMFVPAAWPEDELIDDPELLGARLSSPLTPRQLEVLQLAADGRNAPAIARELWVSPVTVNTHFANIYTKLGVRDRASAVARALRLGLIS